MAPGLAISAILGGLWCALSLTPLTAGAQVNTEKLRTGAAEPGLHGFLDGSLLLKRGNVRLLQVSTGARIEYNVGVHTPYLQGDFTFGQKGDDDVFINNGFGHARWTAMWHERVGTEVFTQLQFNEFLRLNLRFLAGAGVRVAAFVSEPLELILGTGYMFELESLDLDPGSVHARDSRDHRWTSYLTLKLDLLETARLVSITYVQPRLDALSDLRVLEDVVLEVDLGEELSLLVSATVTFDADPPDGVDRVDVAVAPRLRVKF